MVPASGSAHQVDDIVLGVQVAAWMQDGRMVEQALRALAHALLDCKPAKEKDEELTRAVSRLPQHHATRLCAHLLSLQPLRRLLAELPITLHGTLLQVCAQPVAAGAAGASPGVALRAGGAAQLHPMAAAPPHGRALSKSRATAFLTAAALVPRLVQLDLAAACTEAAQTAMLQALAGGMPALTGLTMCSFEHDPSDEHVRVACAALIRLPQLRSLAADVVVMKVGDDQQVVAADALAGALDALQLTHLALRRCGHAPTYTAYVSGCQPPDLVGILQGRTALHTLCLQGFEAATIAACSQLQLQELHYGVSRCFSAEGVDAVCALATLTALSMSIGPTCPIEVDQVHFGRLSNLQRLQLTGMYDESIAELYAEDLLAGEAAAVSAPGWRSIGRLTRLTELELSATPADSALNAPEDAEPELWLAAVLPCLPELRSLQLRGITLCRHAAIVGARAVATRPQLHSLSCQLAFPGLLCLDAAVQASLAGLTRLDLLLHLLPEGAVTEEAFDSSGELARYGTEVLMQLAHLPALQQLSVEAAGSGCRLPLHALSELAPLSTLRSLHLRRCRPWPGGAWTLAGVTELRITDVVRTPEDPKRRCLRAFAEMPALRSLQVCYTDAVRSTDDKIVFTLPATGGFELLTSMKVDNMHFLSTVLERWLAWAGNSALEQMTLGLVEGSRRFIAGLQALAANFNLQHAGSKHCLLIAP